MPLFCQMDGTIGVAATGVTLGVAVVLDNQRVWTHCHLFLPARDRT